MPPRPHVALIIESSRAYGRGLLDGIARYSRNHGPWALYCHERLMGDAPPDWLQSWKGDGIIARIESRQIEEAVILKGLPAVDLRGKFHTSLPLIETDDRAVARIAAEHLLERGFRHFAYCGFTHVNYSARRLLYFPSFIREAGYKVYVYPPNPPDEQTLRDIANSRVSEEDSTSAQQRWQEQHGILFERDVAAWIESLPKPIGIMACNDIRGQQVLNACRAIGVAVPDEVAVIGVDNDELLCELSDPPLSSVEPDTQSIGFEAAALLDRLMRDEPPPQENLFIAPRRVATRQSTDVTAIEDREVAGAVRYIREHACTGINVEDVLRHVPLSRSALDRRFTREIGRSPKAEITRVQLARVKQLLLETDYTLAAIAQLAGFKHAEYLSNVFKQKVGITPGRFREGRQIATV